MIYQVKTGKRKDSERVGKPSVETRCKKKIKTENRRNKRREREIVKSAKEMANERTRRAKDYIVREREKKREKERRRITEKE